MATLVLYHDDPDGWACGWLMSKRLGRRARYSPINYGDHVDVNLFDGATVYLLDFAFQPWSMMQKVAAVAEKLVWIDHHRTAIEAFEKEGLEGNDVEAYVREGLGACGLVWDKYFSGEMPLWLSLIAHYDVWKFPRGDMHFHLIAWMNHHSLPLRTLDDACWKQLEDTQGLEQALQTGKLLFEAWLKEKQNTLSQIGCRRRLFGGHDCVVVNGKGFNSLPFERHPDYKDADIWVTFFYLPSGLWTVSLYSKKVDVGSIARRLGGGGHKGAAGFQATTAKMMDLGILSIT